ncbi:hypothetical protein [Romboutsia sp. 1001285H_161024_C4]|uniref:hypothetical protein n=1 Tax=Romboutsia sp. 1001285H_161024_C4 TaxID=2787109 RepID=UPI00189C0408|nr:hypothetical protein [Romboutsia sp. 1001285H_161024_C4]
MIKIMTSKKYEELMNAKEVEHARALKELSDKYEECINRVSDDNFDLRMEINSLKRDLNSLDNDKVRYLKMIENKRYKGKRLRKKQYDKLIKTINILFGGEFNEI